MKVVIGSDHHGIVLREKIATQLQTQGHTVEDMGTCSTESVDYPDIAGQVAGAVGAGNADRGILICGSGIGMAIAANKVKGVRAAPCYDERTAVMSRSHNNLNVLCMSDDMVGHGRNLRIVDLWMSTEFEGGRHQRRVEKIGDLESA